MQSIKHILFLLLVAFVITSCGNNDEDIDYRSWIVGEWGLKNSGELERYLKNKTERPYLFKNATILFAADGSIETKLMKLDKKSWITHTGRWEMPKRGKLLSIKSDTGPLRDQLKIDFPDERTFYIRSNGLLYHFVKLKSIP